MAANGGAPSLERLEALLERAQLDAADALATLHYDVALSTDAQALGALTRLVPTSRLLLGTDYPMGQEIGVTPIQMVTAAATLANGGVMMKPYLVSEIRDQKGHLLKEVLPQVKRRVVSPETARTMTTILEGVVTNGTGTKAAIPGYRVAGKTGTAQKIDPRTGTYSATQFVGSFVGYVPADALSPLGNDQLCYVKDATGWKIGGFVGGEE